MRIVLYFVFIFLPVFCTAQNTWTWVEVDVLNAPNFNLTTSADLETEQVIPNSLQVTVRSEFYYGSIYAAIPSGISSKTSTPMSVGNVRLKLNHTTCPSSAQTWVEWDPVIMNNTPSKLFTQRWLSGIQSWYYDVIVPPLGYAYQAGTYNFTLVFTMTQP